MDCRQAGAWIDAYVDGELDARSAVELEKHLAGCASCARLAAGHRALSGGLRAGALSYPAPAALRRKLAPRAAPAQSPWRPLALSLGFAALILVGADVAVRWRAFGARDVLAEEAISDHVRSLQAAHLTDVASTDKHTVKPWFAGKLDFSPDVQDLKDQGFPLVGGRLDYLGRRPVAALVYRRAAHTINVFVFPGQGPETSLDLRGFHLHRWSKDGLTYWAVSDLNAAELAQLAALLRGRE